MEEGERSDDRRLWNLMKTSFHHLQPYYFWKKLPFTQWTETENQFTYTEKVMFYGPGGEQDVVHTFRSTEHWMMWQKAKLFNDHQIANQILDSKTPREVKALGRQVNGFDDEMWNIHKMRIVYEGNMLKFEQNPKWAEKLKEVVRQGCYFVEASPFDEVWGIGLNPEDAKAGKEWRGQNLLGIVLTNVAIDLLAMDQLVIYQEDVNYSSVPVCAALSEYLSSFIDVTLYPNFDAIENDFADVVSKFVENRFGIGEFRHHH
jgi:ribA/ribD-fused uncharacterized protein